MGFDYELKDGPGLILGKFFPMSRGALSSASPALCRGGLGVWKNPPCERGAVHLWLGRRPKRGLYER